MERESVDDSSITLWGHEPRVFGCARKRGDAPQPWQAATKMLARNPGGPLRKRPHGLWEETPHVVSYKPKTK